MTEEGLTVHLIRQVNIVQRQQRTYLHHFTCIFVAWHGGEGGEERALGAIANRHEMRGFVNPASSDSELGREIPATF